MQNNALQAIGARWRLSLRADVLQNTYARRVWLEAMEVRRTRTGWMRGTGKQRDVTGTKSGSMRYPLLRPVTETQDAEQCPAGYRRPLAPQPEG